MHMNQKEDETAAQATIRIFRELTGRVIPKNEREKSFIQELEKTLPIIWQAIEQ